MLEMEGQGRGCMGKIMRKKKKKREREREREIEREREENLWIRLVGDSGRNRVGESTKPQGIC